MLVPYILREIFRSISLLPFTALALPLTRALTGNGLTLTTRVWQTPASAPHRIPGPAAGTVCGRIVRGNAPPRIRAALNHDITRLQFHVFLIENQVHGAAHETVTE
jgi:hypothetical protein